jgi:hypothetical protein
MGRDLVRLIYIKGLSSLPCVGRGKQVKDPFYSESISDGLACWLPAFTKEWTCTRIRSSCSFDFAKECTKQTRVGRTASSRTILSKDSRWYSEECEQWQKFRTALLKKKNTNGVTNQVTPCSRRAFRKCCNRESGVEVDGYSDFMFIKFSLFRILKL